MSAPVPGAAPAVPSEAAVRHQVQAQQNAAAMQANEIRELATVLQRPPYAFQPATIRKGSILSHDSAGTPPTVGIAISGDTTTTIPGVRYLDSYTPVIGHTVLLIKQGTDMVVLGHIAE